jgi:hypothetical protein
VANSLSCVLHNQNPEIQGCFSQNAVSACIGLFIQFLNKFLLIRWGIPIRKAMPVIICVRSIASRGGESSRTLGQEALLLGSKTTNLPKATAAAWQHLGYTVRANGKLSQAEGAFIRSRDEGLTLGGQCYGDGSRCRASRHKLEAG